MALYTDIREPVNEPAVESCTGWGNIEAKVRSVTGAIGTAAVSSTCTIAWYTGWMWIDYAYKPKVDTDDAAVSWTGIGGPDADVYYYAYAMLW